MMTRLLKREVKAVSVDHRDDNNVTLTVREERTLLRMEQAEEVKDMLQSVVDIADDALGRATFDNATMRRAAALCKQMGTWPGATGSEEEQLIRRVRQKR